jgi:hypothetical protein
MHSHTPSPGGRRERWSSKFFERFTHNLVARSVSAGCRASSAAEQALHHLRGPRRRPSHQRHCCEPLTAIMSRPDINL